MHHEPWQNPEQNWVQPHYQQYYQQPMNPYPHRSVEEQRGLGGLANTTHLLLTLFTCSLWAFIWIPWAVWRELVPRKKTTRHYY